MIRLTITIGPANGGVGLNVRQDGKPENHLEALWLGAMRHAITDATAVTTAALEKAGIVKSHDMKTGEAARVAGEQRNGVPGAPGTN